jgi:thymidylate synthase (FAD)
MQNLNKPTDLRRPEVASLDPVIGVKIPVLDDGFVRLVDYMGDDSAIVQAARVSYGAGTRKISEDRGLIRYLMRNAHTTPFEMCEIKLHVRAPMDTWRQWIRHRTASVNEYSTRYSVAIDAAQATSPSDWREQSAENKQGSAAYLSAEVGEALSRAESDLQKHARGVYEHRLSLNVAREQARKDLPLSTYTEAYWKINLHNLFHFLQLRMDRHAQHEIRAYAAIIGDQIVAKWCPIAWEAFKDYRLASVSLSSVDTRIIKLLIAGKTAEVMEELNARGMLTRAPSGYKSNRERRELELKLQSLGLQPPWTTSSEHSS